MITARDVSKRFDKTEALRQVSLQVAQGELFALIGPDGAGKTTFIRIVAGLLAPSAGSVTVEARSFGMVPQRFALYEDLTVDENIQLRARLYSVPDAVARKRSDDLLGRVGLERFGARLAGALSGGMKQKLALVAALLIQPELLLLDEPTTGVDPVSRREFWQLLNQLHHEGLTILVSTPYMDEAEYASRLAFLDRGRLRAVGTREEVLATHTRPLVEVRSSDRMRLRGRLREVPEVDDVSLFGTRLHVRGTGGPPERFLETVRRAVDGEPVRLIEPSLEDVFATLSEEE